MEDKEIRWEKAQHYEKKWWASRKNFIDFDFYKSFSDELLFFIKEHYKIDQSTVILEIGSGAGGIVTYLKESNNRYAIDPLENFYSSVEEFINQRDKNVIYKNAKGESLPFNDSTFDFLIIDNVLDHCENPELVISESKRVLKQDKYIYFKQNTYHFWGRFLRHLMELLLIDKGHPHTFSKENLNQLILNNNFKIIKSDRKGYFNTWKKEISSRNIKNIFKALLFVTRDKVTYLIQKL